MNSLTVPAQQATTEDMHSMAEVGEDMLGCASRQWFQYDDNGSFIWDVNENGSRTISDPDEDKSMTITPLFFFIAHRRLIWEGAMADLEGGADTSWWNWASKVNGADPDDYDDWSCDFVLQALLYGKVVYG